MTEMIRAAVAFQFKLDHDIGGVNKYMPSFSNSSYQLAHHHQQEETNSNNVFNMIEEKNWFDCSFGSHSKKKNGSHLSTFRPRGMSWPMRPHHHQVKSHRMIKVLTFLFSGAI